MSRARKPNEQHRRDGTLNTTKHLNGDGSVLLPAVPVFGPDFMLWPVDEAWASLLDEGVAWLARTDVPKALMLRDSLRERARLMLMLAEDESDWRVRASLRALNKEIATLLSELGFDPTARARLGLAEVRAQSKLEELRARRSPTGRPSDQVVVVDGD